MSSFIASIERFAQTQADTRAFFNSKGESISYGQLSRFSSAFAEVLYALNPRTKPVAVYGHKSPFMLVTFLACAKSGSPYVPLDTSLPQERLASILEQLDSPLLINTAEDLPHQLESLTRQIIVCSNAEELDQLCVQQQAGALPDDAVTTDQDTFYILFTSGSTGVPKGVEISAANIDAYHDWMCTAFCKGEPQVFFNRAPFSFDLSVTDLVRGLGAGDTLFALENEAEASLKSTFDALSKSGVSFWISTPSFADMCLADATFGQALLPQLRTFFFVGETLRNETAAKLLERFDQARVINGYGPTESTVLVAATEITKQDTDVAVPLPVGRAKPNVELVVLDPDTNALCEPGVAGELYIIGDTVAKGYFNNEEATKKAFASYPFDISPGKRSYRTGDECILDETGMLHFRGRFDFQTKLHGYRIELGDIEANLCALEVVQQACVLPIEREGVISFLRAFVVLDPSCTPSFQTTRLLKSQLGQRLPEYMIPRSFIYVEAMPLNANGKVDRNALKALPKE